MTRTGWSIGFDDSTDLFPDGRVDEVGGSCEDRHALSWKIGKHPLQQGHPAGLGRPADAIAGRREVSLAEAAAVGDVKRVGELIRGGAQADERSPDGFTPLQLGCYLDNTGAAALLIRAGADSSARATGAMVVQPLHSAAASPTGSCVPLVIAVGVDVNQTQSGGFTALYAAALRRDERMAELLLAAGANPGARAEDGRSAADMAEASGAPQLAERLRRS